MRRPSRLAAALWLTIRTSAAAGDPAEPPPPPAPERLVWNKAPLRLTLGVGRERIVRFPAPVEIGVPPALAGALRTQIVDETVYWQAGRAFDPIRVQVRELASGRIILVDLRAIDGTTPVQPVEVVATAATLPALPAALPPLPAGTPGTAALPPPPAAPAAGGGAGRAPRAPAAATEPEASPPRIGMVALTRYAAQQLYAPERLAAVRAPGIVRAAVRLKPVDNLFRGADGGGVLEARPIAAWRTGGLWVTAVRLHNTGGVRTVDPRNLRGRWLAATFQHARLGPDGSDTDVTCLYLVSAQPFEESL